MQAALLASLVVLAASVAAVPTTTLAARAGAPTGKPIHPGSETTKCVDVVDVNGDAYSATSGSLVKINDCNGNTSQSWYLHEFENPERRVILAGTSWCLDAGSTTSGTQVKLEDCGYANETPAPSRSWVWTIGNQPRLSVENSNQCLTLTNGSKINGNILTISSCSQDPTNQVWTHEQ